MTLKNKGSKYLKNRNFISSVLTTFIIALLVLVGPASAIEVGITQPNDATQGGDVSFDVTVDINTNEIVPIEYTDIEFTGPNGFSKTCRVYNDGTDDCDDVDISVSKDLSLNYGYGYGYAVDLNYGYGYGYNFGYGYGYGASSTEGTITYSVTWHTTTGLTAGTYNAQVGVYVKGDISHTFASSQVSFTISTPPPPDAPPDDDTGAGGGGGGSVSTCGDGMCSGYETCENCAMDCGECPEEVTEEATTEEGTGAEETTETGPETTGLEGLTGGAVIEKEEGKGLRGILGAVVGGGSTVSKGIGALFWLAALILLGFLIVERSKKKENIEE